MELTSPNEERYFGLNILARVFVGSCPEGVLVLGQFISEIMKLMETISKKKIMKTIKLEHLFERTYFKFVHWFVFVARFFCNQKKGRYCTETSICLQLYCSKPPFVYNCTAVNLYLFITVLQ